MQVASKDGTTGASEPESAARRDLRGARPLGSLGTIAGFAFETLAGERNVWVSVSLRGRETLALRLGPNAGALTHLHHSTESDGTAIFEFATPAGAMRARISFPAPDRPVVRCTVSLMPVADGPFAGWPRDVYVLGQRTGQIHTAQRGLRSGIVYASCPEPGDEFALFYFQNFSALNEFCEATGTSPADSVGGRWPEFGYAIPASERRGLPKAREFVVSDAYLTLAADAPGSDRAAAAQYLDLLAETYLHLDKPAIAYRDWLGRAERTLTDLTLSPDCSYVRRGRRFAVPYVGDRSKPPESMVQFTLGVNLAEYDRWRGKKSSLATALRETIPEFFDPDVGSVVRWLPGAEFDESQAEDNMSHAAMDSWYLHHAAFNVFRYARDGDAQARRVFEASLPYLVRVAHRFEYHWPVFFDLRSLDIIRAESVPGAGGETDVAGLYALVMLHAYELLGEPSYLEEAEAALSRLDGLGFELAYQLNTTGFAAEAALRLWKLTGKRIYLELSEVALANIFDNMWLWCCEYGAGAQFRTFFGLFPLRDAPYIAPYEELEAHAKFHDYLALGGDDVRPSLRLLLGEFQKYGLDRGWFFYAGALPDELVARKPRTGKTERSLSIPLEDVRDGRGPFGEVGQEVYGAGLPFVFVTRHYFELADGAALAYCNYPAYDFAPAGDGTWAMRLGGDPRGTAEVRIVPAGADAPAQSIRVRALAGSMWIPVRGALSTEGHAVFAVRGGQRLEIQCAGPENVAEGATIVGWTQP